MRTYLLAAATAALFALPVSAFSQGTGIWTGSVGRIEPYRDHHGYAASRGECRELRAACMHKGELGVQDRGNCQRYREVCRGY
jgi:hypothetical protein